MKRTGIAVVALGLGLGLFGCSGGSASPVASSSVPPDDLPACSDIYKEGAKVDDATFGLACVQNDQVVSPRPVQLECTDGRELRYNELAWGYVSEPMTLTPEDDPSKTPETAVSQCLAPEPGVSVPESDTN